jgi:AcrR family transcriptional regulator
MISSMSLRERKKAEKLQRIVAAAQALFAEKGFDKTTTREIAQRAQIGTGTLFTYVESKEELVILIWDEQVQAIMHQRMATIPKDAELIEQILHMFAGLFDFYAEAHELAVVYLQQALWAEGSARDRVEARNAEFMAAMVQMLQAAQARKEVRADLPLMETALILFGSYAMSLMSFLRGDLPDVTAALDLSRRTLAIQLQGFQATR